jgi:2C-methyl-D-erythritol 2,4-cyclodiphosphate synthase
MEFLTLAEKKIHDDVEKMFGDKDPELKMITKLSMLKELYGDDDDMEYKIENVINKMKLNAVKELKLIDSELKCSLDLSGNVIILLEKV